MRGEDTVYAAQVQDIRGELVPGQAADLLDAAGNFVGRGLVGGSSKALLRLLTRSREDIDRAFSSAGLRRPLNTAAGWGRPSAAAWSSATPTGCRG